MRLSEAILLGLPEIRFTNGGFLTKGPSGCQGCLLGAALYAEGRRGYSEFTGIDEVTAIHWPWTKDFETELSCPKCGTFGPLDIPSLLTHLANHYSEGKMTAEQIADIIRQIEPSEESPIMSEPAPTEERVKV